MAGSTSPATVSSAPSSRWTPTPPRAASCAACWARARCRRTSLTGTWSTKLIPIPWRPPRPARRRPRSSSVSYRTTRTAAWASDSAQATTTIPAPRTSTSPSRWRSEGDMKFCTPSTPRLFGLWVALLVLLPWAAVGDTTRVPALGISTITSGTTPISGGATTQVCYNSAGTLACGDAGLTYDATTDRLTVNELLALTGTTGGVYFGGNDGGRFGVRTELTPDSMQLSTGTTGNSVHFLEDADVGFDFNNGRCGTSACSDPSLILHSRNQNVNQYLHLSSQNSTGAAELQTSSAEIMLGGVKTNITEAAAQVIARITLPTSGVYGALVTYTVSDQNATPDFVVRNGSIQVQGANKAGTATCTILATRDQETEDGSSAAVTGGALTLTYTWTNVANTTSCDLSLNGASNAGVNTYDISYTVHITGATFGTTITPQ